MGCSEANTLAQVTISVRLLLAPFAATALLLNLWVSPETHLLGAHQQKAASVALPNRPDSFKFAVLGNSGTGEQAQYELAEQMAALQQRFKYELVLLLGGNVQGGERPQDFVNKFEKPYRPLLDAGVKFYAALGNDDAREQRYYKNFNMNGKLHYTFDPRPDVLFVALESTYIDTAQIEWLEAMLTNSKSAWRIVYLHHPLYSSARRHGSDSALRGRLETLFLKHHVSVVFSARDAVYERTRPQNGITYFVVGSGGMLRRGGIDPSSGLTAKSFDTDLAFLAAEISGDQMHFNAISRTGETVDSGVLARRK